MSLINISHLNFSYPGAYDNIFSDVSFQIDTAWKLGFVGRNGRGKTTFLRLLAGEYEYSGTISASTHFDYFPFSVADATMDTIDIVNSINHNYEQWELLRELSLLGVSEDVLYRPYSTLSNGEQTKTMLAVLFLKENNFLLIDEPTNHLDSFGRDIVSRYLNSKSGFILVSHDRSFLDRCTDHTLSINKTDIELQRGNFSSFWHNRELRDNFELAQDARLKKDIKRLETAVARTARWSDSVEATKYGTRNSGLRPDKGYIGHKSAKMMKRSKSIESRQSDAIAEKKSLLKNLEEAPPLAISPIEHHSDRLLSLKDVGISYDGMQVCDSVSFELLHGMRVSLRGKNGSGKSSILKLILGDDIEHTGELWLSPGLIISYVSQNTDFLCGNLKDFSRENNIDESQLKTILVKLDFSRDQLLKNMEDFSGGQKKKVLIARSLCSKAHLYIWDEPLNFIDVLSRMQIENLILEHEPTMLFVEHDMAFVDSVATYIVEI